MHTAPLSLTKRGLGNIEGEERRGNQRALALLKKKGGKRGEYIYLLNAAVLSRKKFDLRKPVSEEDTQKVVTRTLKGCGNWPIDIGAIQCFNVFRIFPYLTKICSLPEQNLLQTTVSL